MPQVHSPRVFLSLALAVALPAGMAQAEVELSFYGGWQTAPHSDVAIRGNTLLADQDFTARWEGRSFEAPPYYGIRATWWQDQSLGYGVDFTHAKIYASQSSLDAAGLDHLEFSDGINYLTANVYYRWQEAFGLATPYVGGGLGLSIPHVEVRGNGSETWDYQVTGPAVALMAGVSYPINHDWSVFTEYKGVYSENTADLDDGGMLKTDVVTNALNVGVSFNF